MEATTETKDDKKELVHIKEKYLSTERRNMFRRWKSIEPNELKCYDEYIKMKRVFDNIKEDSQIPHINLKISVLKLAFMGVSYTDAYEDAERILRIQYKGKNERITLRIIYKLVRAKEDKSEFLDST